MRIVGFNFRRISAEIKEDIKGKLEITSDIRIEDIEKEIVDIAGDVLKFSYIYTIKYNPNFAEIIFKGIVLVSMDKPDDLKNVLKEWKSKKIPEDIKIFVYNFIMSKCNIRALQLEEDFILPPHIPFPRLTKQSKPQSNPAQANYTG